MVFRNIIEIAKEDLGYRLNRFELESLDGFSYGPPVGGLEG